MSSTTEQFLDDEVLIYRGNPAYPGHDALGFRNTIPVEAADTLIMGNSHTYGTMLPADDSWPVVLQRDYLRGVYSIALGGWSFYQYFAWSRCVGAMRPRVLIVTVFTGYDFYGTTNHYLRNRERFARRFPRAELGEPPGFALHWRADKENYIRQKMKELGVSQGTALRQARCEGHEDCYHHSAADGDHFFEVRLRSLLTDTRHPWIAKGVEIAEVTLSWILERIPSDCRRIVVIYPTKEFVFGTRFPGLCETTPYFRNLLRSESELISSFSASCRRLGAEVWDLTGFFVRRCDRGLYHADTRDGHYTRKGAARIARLVDARLGRDSRASAPRKTFQG